MCPVPVPRQVSLSYALYPRDAIERAEAAFAELCEVREETTPTASLLTILPRPGAPPDAVPEFLSYALLAALEIQLGTSG
jgi:hypothetical protein